MESRRGAGPTARLRQLHLETTNRGAAGGRSRGCTPPSPGEAQDSETGGQAHDVGLQRRSFILGLHDDLSIATERVCTVLGDWVSQGEERDSPKKPDCPGKTKAAPVRAGRSEQSSLHPGLSRSEASRASSQLRPIMQADKPTQVQSPQPAVQVRARTHTRHLKLPCLLGLPASILAPLFPAQRGVAEIFLNT